ncbi:MAG: type VI secretion system baseplate subunit TssE [Phycisphaerales bacterium]|nr:MAG: type VI secretion system baseplate subunit TssE [Phycisphaerales bacterium]
MSSDQVTLSVFDRLVSRSRTNGLRHPSGGEVDEYLQQVRRDLENLLNSRCWWSDYASDLHELDRSIVTYGLVDFSAEHLGHGTRREEFRRLIERVIRRFEPRIHHPRVELHENVDLSDRTLRFRIEGVLKVEPLSEQIAFDTSVEPTNSSFVIDGVDV